MFYQRRTHILDMVTSHWMNYVVLCDARLLQAGGRKLVNVLKLVTMLKKKGQFKEFSLCSVFSSVYQTHLPAMRVRSSTLDLQIEFYIDPLESQEGKLRFNLVATAQGRVVHRESVTWSSKKGPDLIHAYFLLDLVDTIDRNQLVDDARARAHVNLVHHLERLGSILGISYLRVGDSYSILVGGRIVGTVGLIQSHDSFITNFSYNSTSGVRRLPFRKAELDALIL